jgi:hypothetical protein
MKSQMLAVVLITSFMLIGCHKDGHGDSSSDTNSSESEDINTTNRFSAVSNGGDTVWKDATTKLQWVASTNGYTSAVAATTEASDKASADSYCSSISFGGYSDWRVPTSYEHSVFVKAMLSEGSTPFYADSNALKLIGIDGNLTKAVNTHNSSPVGGIITWEQFMEKDSTTYSIKCVRNN